MHTENSEQRDEPQRQMATGVVAAAATVLIWSLWLVTTRQAATVHLPVAWLAMIRFAIPAVMLAPFWWRHGLLPRGVSLRLMALMVLGAGAPYFALVAAGMHFAGAAESGVLLGGTMPLFTALFAAVIYRERFGPGRVLGFALVIVAMGAIGGVAVIEGHGAGRWLLVAGAALWAVFTHAYHRSGLAALPAAGIVAAWSTILVAPFAFMEGTDALLAAGPGVLAGEALSQGVLSGVVALACYGTAVRILGSSRAALMAALPPAVAAVLAIPMLGEVPSPLTLGGVALAVVGVALATGAVKLGVRRAVAEAAPERATPAGRMSEPIRIVGIDPGLRATGWGVVAIKGNELSFLAAGTIKVPADGEMAARLVAIHAGLAEMLGQWQPDEAAVEQSFVNRDAQATLKLGQARGIALLAPAQLGLAVAEYAPNAIKKAIVGAGHAEKGQIRAMVRVLLPRATFDSDHAADALAIAICHAHHRQSAALRMALSG